MNLRGKGFSASPFVSVSPSGNPTIPVRGAGGLLIALGPRAGHEI